MIFSLLDRALISFVNLVYGLVLIKYATTDGYAYYSLVFASMMLVGGIGNSIVSTPLTVYMYDKRLEEQDNFVLQHIVMGAVMLLVFSLLALFLILTANYLFIFEVHRFVFIGLAASSLYSLFEIVRKTIMAEMRHKMLFILDVAQSAVGALVVCIGLICYEYQLFELVLLGFCVSYAFMTVVFLFVKYGNKLLSGIYGLSFRDLTGLWIRGCWGLLGMSVTWAGNQGFLYLALVLVNREFVAMLNASKLIVSPLQTLYSSMASFYLPKIAKIAKPKGKAKIELLNFLGINMLFLLVYTIFVVISYDLIKQKILESYNVDAILIAWFVHSFFISLRIVGSIGLQAEREFKRLAFAMMISTGIGLSVSAILTSFAGSTGFMFGLVCTEILAMTIVWGNLNGIWRKVG